MRSPDTFVVPSEVCRTQGFSLPLVLHTHQHPLLGSVRRQAGKVGAEAGLGGERTEEETLHPRFCLLITLDWSVTQAVLKNVLGC